MYTYKELWKQYKILSTNIKHYRQKKNLTQEQLAEIANISTSYIKQIESGKEIKNISLIYIIKIAKALDIPTEYLFKEPKTVNS